MTLSNIPYYTSIQGYFTYPFRLFTIQVDCDDYYMTNNYLLIYKDQCIKIYRHTKCTKHKLIKVVQHHLLIFIINKLKKKVLDFLYRILINMVEERVENIETCLTNLIIGLEVLDIIKLREYSEYFVLVYKNKEEKYNNKGISNVFDNIINVNNNSFNQSTPCMRIKTILHNNEMIIYHKAGIIYIEREDEKKTIKCSYIKKVKIHGEYIVVQGDGYLKVLVSV